MRVSVGGPGNAVQLPEDPVSVWPICGAVLLIVGAVAFTGWPATALVAAESFVTVPPGALLTAVSRTKICFPTSAASTVYDDPGASDEPHVETHHCTVMVGGGYPVQVPAV